MGNVNEIVSFDDMMDALGDVQRRKLLVTLLEHKPQEDAPVVIAGSDSEADADRHRTKMHHVHLPKLANYGFIEWDKETDEVMKGPKFDEIGPLLELLATHEDELPADWV